MVNTSIFSNLSMNQLYGATSILWLGVLSGYDIYHKHQNMLSNLPSNLCTAVMWPITFPLAMSGYSYMYYKYGKQISDGKEFHEKSNVGKNVILDFNIDNQGKIDYKIDIDLNSRKT